MCNLYSMTRARAEAARLARAMRDRGGNNPLQPGIYPDYTAPIVRVGEDGEREVADVRWGLPSSKKALFDAAIKRADKLRAKGKEVDFAELLRLEPDSGTTNIRNTASSHWKQWLGPENRCLVPFTSFCEPDQASGSKEMTWFALGEDRPLAFFAGVWVRDWTSCRKVKDGEVTCDLFAFLTTDANAEVRAIHPAAMPVILTTEDEREMWMNAPWELARDLQRPLPDWSLQIVLRGARQDLAALGG
jgi:putative SOS response-associated peptidase YedK